MTKSDQEGGADASAGSNAEEKERVRKQLGLHLPIFYFSVSNYATPDTLYKIDKKERENIEGLIHQFGNWKAIEKYYKSLKKGLSEHYAMKPEVLLLDTSLSEETIRSEWNNIAAAYTSLLQESNAEIVTQNYKVLESTLNNNHFSHLSNIFREITNNKHYMENNSERWKLYVPEIKFYGTDNQYHVWIFGNGRDRHGIIRGDFGRSYNDKQEIKDKIWDRIGISFLLSILSIFIAYLISIPIGIYSAYKKDSFADRGMSLLLFILYSLPSFFIGTLLLLWFANTENLYWFPESGIENAVTVDPNWKWWEWEAIKHRAPYLVLPLFTYTYGSFAFLSRIMRIGMIDVIAQDYIRTARAKGLSEKKVILKHALRNSLLPIITVFAAVFPMAVGGSVIIEVIFSIPGMGSEIFIAITNQDYPMIISFFTLAGLLTMIGYLVSDILYALVDPRISYK